MKSAFYPRSVLVALLLPIGLGPFAAAEEAQPRIEKPPTETATSTPTVEPDPFAAPSAEHRKATVADGRSEEKLPVVQVRLEIWETPALELAKRLDGIADAKGVEQLREDFLAGKTGSKLIASPSSALDPLSSANLESISEWTYPTEYVPPEVPPAKETGKAEAIEAVSPGVEIPPNRAFSCPTAFETRNAGMTLLASIQQVSAEANRWDVAVSFESIEHAGDLNYGEPKYLIKMPVFTSFRVQGTFRCAQSRWQLASVQAPPKGIDGKDGLRWVCLLRVDPAED